MVEVDYSAPLKSAGIQNQLQKNPDPHKQSCYGPISALSLSLVFRVPSIQCLRDFSTKV
jgi:hypothetical protein